MIARAAIGALAAAAIALLAWRGGRGALSASGAAAAWLLGTITIAAGWEWGGLLLAFFLSSMMLSHAGADVKAERTSAIIAKGGSRDLVQVLANGGLFAAAALLWMATGWLGWLAVGGGALAAATADTWGTEVGTLSSTAPRLITTWEPVPAGTSGGITLPGTTGTLCGAAFIALGVGIAAWPAPIAVATLLGGIAGALADSFLGARYQEQRHCSACDAFTERHVHHCGSRTDPAGGVKWLDNDAVNLLSAACGGAVALAWWATR